MLKCTRHLRLGGLTACESSMKATMQVARLKGKALQLKAPTFLSAGLQSSS